jgi:hypothetical protein
VASVASKVRSYIDNLGSNVVFATKELLHCGGRNAVDHALSRFVGKKLITRLAAGVFVVLISAEVPTAAEIAQKKADVFHKKIIESKITHTGEWTFLTNGCRSSFRSIHGRVYFKTVSLRRIQGDRSREEAISLALGLRSFSPKRTASGQSNAPVARTTLEPSYRPSKIALSVDLCTSSGRSSGPGCRPGPSQNDHKFAEKGFSLLSNGFPALHPIEWLKGAISAWL